MPPGDQSSYTDKQKRQAAHIEAAYVQRGLGTKAAQARVRATVNHLSGGGRRSESGRHSRSLVSGG